MKTRVNLAERIIQRVDIFGHVPFSLAIRAVELLDCSEPLNDEAIKIAIERTYNEQ